MLAVQGTRLTMQLHLRSFVLSSDPLYPYPMGNKELLVALRNFVAERNWQQFHTPENLAKSISIESSELLELFQWSEPSNIDEVKDELADVLTYCILLADKYDLDIEKIVLEKLEKTKAKYPVDKSFGRSEKYDRL
jgi:dCTP diphosphatase